MLSLKSIADKIREIANEYPDSVYNGGSWCWYTTHSCGGGVGCIVGQALIALDPALKPLLEQIDSLKGHINQGFNKLFPMFTIVIDRENIYIKWICRVQIVQDNGQTWGEAIARADTLHPLPKEE